MIKSWLLFLLCLGIFSLGLFSACSSLPVTPSRSTNVTAPTPTQGLPVQKPVIDFSQDGKVKIFFQTNRDKKSPSFDFQNKIGSQTTQGSLQLTQQLGVVELPTRLPIETLTPDYFYQKLLEDPSAPILIFIHGFNVPFIEAAQKAAQIKQDLKFQGPVVLWSWPAGAQEGLLQSTLLTRTYDENFKSAQASIPPFTDFLNRLLKEHAHLILMIHSMGHQVALPSILRLTPSVASDSQDKTQNKIQQLILNAPDYDMDQFADSLDRLHVKVEHITLYCSPYDKALQASEKYNRSSRLGNCEKFDGVDVINVGEINKPGMLELGHGLYSSRAVLMEV
jgi:esterase/lipase superfamily enzyme